MFASLCLCRIDGHVVAVDPTDGSGGQRVSLGRLFEGFTRAVRDGGEPPASFARAVEVQRIVEALYASHRRKAWVDLTPGADLG
ncbi:hypothetical protein [Polyangium fumosum]|uniref:hypothetical protein n=1 Tax=Polyangium fumosum TaxID=889272 RepID=UPI001478EB0C|nr:hypothetical protein [Polyangium fumosum]